MTTTVRGEQRLEGVHPDLVLVVRAAYQTCTEFEIGVLEGLRTRERQVQLVASGASRTMKSRHLTGHAVDLGAWVGGALRWDWPLYRVIAVHMKMAALGLAIPIEWGGDWTTFHDGPHFQLTWTAYPVPDTMLPEPQPGGTPT